MRWAAYYKEGGAGLKSPSVPGLRGSRLKALLRVRWGLWGLVAIVSLL